MVIHCKPLGGATLITDGEALYISYHLAMNANKAPVEKEMAATPVFLPGESCGQRSLAGYSPWGRKESDTG